ncbi:hypothetical protein COOONC_11749 [Cooperia oncophora]
MALFELLTIVVLILLDPTYVTAYISVNYEIVLIYIVSALTLLYCIVSVIMYFLLAKRGEETPLTNCSLSEVIFSTAGIMGWLIIIGIGGTISQRTIIETGERFGWIGVSLVCVLILFPLEGSSDHTHFRVPGFLYHFDTYHCTIYPYLLAVVPVLVPSSTLSFPVVIHVCCYSSSWLWSPYTLRCTFPFQI